MELPCSGRLPGKVSKRGNIVSRRDFRPGKISGEVLSLVNSLTSPFLCSKTVTTTSTFLLWANSEEGWRGAPGVSKTQFVLVFPPG